MSASGVAFVPAGVVTMTSTWESEVSSVLAGTVTTIEVGEATVKLVAIGAPKLMELAPVKPVPVTMTVVPPVSGPTAGLSSVTLGGPWKV